LRRNKYYSTEQSSNTISGISTYTNLEEVEASSPVVLTIVGNIGGIKYHIKFGTGFQPIVEGVQGDL